MYFPRRPAVDLARGHSLMASPIVRISVRSAAGCHPPQSACRRRNSQTLPLCAERTTLGASWLPNR